MNITTTYGLLHIETGKLLSAHPSSIYYDHDDSIEIEFDLELHAEIEDKIWETPLLYQACIAQNVSLKSHNEFNYPDISLHLQKSSKVVAIHRLDNGLFYFDENVPQSLDDIFGDFDNFIFLAAHDTITHEIEDMFLLQFKRTNFKDKKTLNDFYAFNSQKAWLQLLHKQKEPKIKADINVFISLIEKSLTELRGN